MNTTKIKKLTIKKFRGLKDIDLDIANKITLICGKNGTSKSTILGIIAQFFNFEKNYQDGSSLTPFKTIYGNAFKSQFREHFRLSEKYDKPNLMEVTTTIFDGYSKQDILANLKMTGHKDRKHRMVVRQLTNDGKQGPSRNFTHPVIYLNLKRLLPITERTYNKIDNSYLNIDKNKEEFCDLTNSMLLRVNRATNVASTSGSIDASVSHGDNYDEEAVSVGEDNVGQICAALLSFKKLKEELKSNYKGGILLIDEADAGLFPASQKELIKILNEYSSNYNLQIVLTTHSPLMINEVLELQRKAPKQHIMHYLTYRKGSIVNERNRSWEWIKNDLLVQTSKKKNTLIPTITLFFEDTQASDFFKELTFRESCKKFIKINRKVSLSCNIYINLSKIVNEIDSNLIIVLDGDTKPTKIPIIIKLPTELPPDQLLFWILYNIPENDEYWDNSLQFTKDVFIKNLTTVKLFKKIPKLDKKGLNKTEFKKIINQYSSTGNKPKARNIFKNFSNQPEIKDIVADPKLNPFKRFIRENPQEKEVFINDLEKALIYAFKNKLNMTENEVKEMMGI